MDATSLLPSLAVGGVAFAILFVTASLLLWWRAAASARETRQAIERGAKVIDVGTPADFESAHLDGADNVPLEDLPRLETDEIGPPDTPIVVLGHGPVRASLAVHELHAKGFRHVMKGDYLRPEDAPASARADDHGTAFAPLVRRGGSAWRHGHHEGDPPRGGQRG